MLLFLLPIWTQNIILILNILFSFVVYADFESFLPLNVPQSILLLQIHQNHVIT